jgi:hypothetical protein
MVQVIGWALVAVGAAFGIAAWFTDRRLQEYRGSEVSRSAFRFVPTRWQRELYRPEGEALVRRARRQLAAMYLLAAVGMVLVAAGAS